MCKLLGSVSSTANTKQTKKKHPKLKLILKNLVAKYMLIDVWEDRYLWDSEKNYIVKKFPQWLISLVNAEYWIVFEFVIFKMLSKEIKVI